MSFGDKRLDRAYDRWVTQTPEEYHHLAQRGIYACESCEQELPLLGIPLCRQCFLQWAREKIKHFGDDKHGKQNRIQGNPKR